MPTRTKGYLNTVSKNKAIRLQPEVEKHPGYAMNWWKRYSYQLRASKPECADCKGLFKPKDLAVDHVIPVSFGGSFDDTRNHAVRCCQCHNIKTAKEKSKPIYESIMNEKGELIPKQNQ